MASPGVIVTSNEAESAESCLKSFGSEGPGKALCVCLGHISLRCACRGRGRVSIVASTCEHSYPGLSKHFVRRHASCSETSPRHRRRSMASDSGWLLRGLRWRSLRYGKVIEGKRRQRD